MTEVTVMSGSIQWGFAGFAFMIFAVLSSVLVWLAKSLLRELRDSNKQKAEMAAIVQGNTEAIHTLSKTGDGTMDLMIEVKDLILTKLPCIGVGRNGQEIQSTK